MSISSGGQDSAEPNAYDQLPVTFLGGRQNRRAHVMIRAQDVDVPLNDNIPATEVFPSLDDFSQLVAIVRQAGLFVEAGDSTAGEGDWIMHGWAKNQGVYADGMWSAIGTGVTDIAAEPDQENVYASYTTIPSPNLQASGWDFGLLWTPADPERSYLEDFDEDDSLHFLAHHESSGGSRWKFYFDYVLVSKKEFDAALSSR